MAFVRRSKYKHIFGKPNKREDCYDNIRITKSSWDSTFCSVNPKYLAIITEAAGGGCFLVLPLDKVGRAEADSPLVAGHKAAVLDIQWCPFNDDLIASASEDCTVKVWQIPEGGLEPKTNLTDPVADLVAHQRRVGLVVWHPTAENVLLSSGADNLVMIWNIETEEVMLEVAFPDMILSASFNYNGSKLVTTCKDRMTRVVNPRTGDIFAERKCHEGSKPQQCVYLKDNRIFTTGFSRVSERQYALWSDENLDAPILIQDLDTTNGVLFPFYDPDCGLIFLCGKGDSCIRYFEVNEDEPYVHYINMLTSSDPQRGIGWLPKRGLTVNNNEIARCYKLHQKGMCEVIPFTVPRKSELFQDDLYPDTAGDMPALTADEWIEGKDADPILVSMKEAYVAKERPNRRVTKTAKISKLAPASAAASSGPAPTERKATSPAPSARDTAAGAAGGRNGSGGSHSNTTNGKDHSYSANTTSSSNSSIAVVSTFSIPPTTTPSTFSNIHVHCPESESVHKLTCEVSELRKTCQRLVQRIAHLEGFIVANKLSPRRQTIRVSHAPPVYSLPPEPDAVEEPSPSITTAERIEMADGISPNNSPDEGRSTVAQLKKLLLSAHHGNAVDSNA